MSNDSRPKFRNYKAKVNNSIPGLPNNGPEVRVRKGRGQEDWMLNNEKLCMKILTLEQGKKCSMHFHNLKEEIFFVVSGTMVFKYIDTETGKLEEYIMNAGETVHIPPCVPHQMWGTSEEPCVFVECSTQHFDDDSYRVLPGDSQRESGD